MLSRVDMTPKPPLLRVITEGSSAHSSSFRRCTGELFKKSIEHRSFGPVDLQGSGIEQSGVDSRDVGIKAGQSVLVRRELGE